MARGPTVTEPFGRTIFASAVNTRLRVSTSSFLSSSIAKYRLRMSMMASVDAALSRSLIVIYAPDRIPHAFRYPSGAEADCTADIRRRERRGCEPRSVQRSRDAVQRGDSAASGPRFFQFF